MWGYQHLFRLSLKIEAKRAFDEVGFDVAPSVFIVGLQVAGQHQYSVCIEPEKGPYRPLDFASITARAGDLYEQHPERNTFHSDQAMHETYHRRLKREMQADAIAEVLNSGATGKRQRFFVGLPVRVGDYRVFIALGIARDALDAVPTLNTRARDRIAITPSLVHAIVDEILQRATKALYIPDAGAGLSVLDLSAQEVVRTATRRFVRAVLFCAGSMFAENHDTLFSGVSALPYEGRSVVGSIVVAKPETSGLRISMMLRDPVSIYDTRAVRKLMEACSPEVQLLMHDGNVYGLGCLTDGYDYSREEAFVVAVLGRGAWELRHSGKSLLSVRDGIVRLPARPLEVEYFKDLLDRLLPDADVSVLLELVEAASRNDHGAMLVVSADAAAEAKRLSPQAWAIEPVKLDPGLILRLTAMDGAILLDPQGRCHAVGVIADGRAAGQGDPSRGSRFNNAIRYLDSGGPPAIIVTFSTDGVIDILPRLRPRVSRRSVEEAVDRYVKLATVRPPELEDVNDAWEGVKILEFYLSRRQCDLLNQKREALDEWRAQHSSIRLLERPLAPSDKMNDRYWKD